MDACAAVRYLLRKKLMKVRGKIRVMRLPEQELWRAAVDEQETEMLLT